MNASPKKPMQLTDRVRSLQNQKCPKYSADVFKMGRGSSDRRCSRIFYSKVQDNLHFYKFDPDRHGGE
ncbi:MAG: hypothetical protein F6J93_00170 [Oscillatoria sp. SIO1A7]|nr:hypothetical protein [Oscillatoria sp. SIO1A7]